MWTLTIQENNVMDGLLRNKQGDKQTSVWYNTTKYYHMEGFLMGNAKEIKLCKHCQTEIPKKAKICPNCKKKQRGILKWVIIFLLALGFIGSIGNSQKENKTQGSQQSATTENDNNRNNETGEEKKDNGVSTNRTNEIDLSEGLIAFDSGEYLYITNYDLNRYCSNMGGVKIYTVIEIDDLKEGRIQSNLSEGFMMSNFYVVDRYEEYKSALEKGDIIAVLGTIVGYDDYSVAGKSVSVENCFVFAIGENAEEYRKENTDERLSEYLVVTESVANLNSDISEEEYKNLCGALNYEDILRNPDSNKGKYCIISGKADQIIEGLFGYYTIYLEDSNGDRWECSYIYKDGEPHILEGDKITVYGKCNGTTTATTVLGKQITLPDIDVGYLE